MEAHRGRKHISAAPALGLRGSTPHAAQLHALRGGAGIDQVLRVALELLVPAEERRDKPQADSDEAQAPEECCVLVWNRWKIEESRLFFIKSNNTRHNIFGIWSIDLMEKLEEDLNNGERKVELWANSVGVKVINMEFINEDPFFNINTKEDLDFV